VTQNFISTQSAYAYVFSTAINLSSNYGKQHDELHSALWQPFARYEQGFLLLAFACTSTQAAIPIFRSDVLQSILNRQFSSNLNILIDKPPLKATTAQRHNCTLSSASTALTLDSEQQYRWTLSEQRIHLQW
jgi:hypothetical protein